MPKFFVDSIMENTYILEGENARHAIKSLRMKVGENITLCDNNKTDFFGVVSDINDGTVCVNITDKCENTAESAVNIHLLQCIPKSDKMDFIVQKAVELGVYDITPINSIRCVSNIKGKELKKIERWNKISLEAAKQCGRGMVPVVNEPLEFSEAVKNAKGDKIIFYEGEALSLREFLNSSNITDITILIGSEGGFDVKEVELAKANDFAVLSLGSRILRAETASISALSIIQYEKDK